MAFISGLAVWQIGKRLTLGCLVDEGGIISSVKSTKCTYLGKDNLVITFETVSGSINDLGGIHVTGYSLDSTTGKYTYLSLSGSVRTGDNYDGDCNYSIMFPDGTSIDEPAFVPGKERGHIFMLNTE